MVEAPGDPKLFLVTGATGFVGRALVKRLLSSGYQVIAVARRDDAELSGLGARIVLADLQGDVSGIEKTLSGLPSKVQCCFHTAAKVGMWGSYEDFYNTNVVGTENLLRLCQAAGVLRFIYTSSPSVIANGKDLRGVDESFPYPEHFDAFYPKTKSIAERAVLSANVPGVFGTLALRPHLIFGPGDTNLIPTIVAKARLGKLKQIGGGSNMVDFTYIDDCIEAHIKGDQALEGDPSVGGRPYFISQGDPYPLWGFINRVLGAHQIPRLTQQVPYSLAKVLASVSELVARLRGGSTEPALTKFLVSEMATDHFFSIEAAKRNLKYVPSGSVDEGLEKTFGAALEPLVKKVWN